jgi:hypothetical protein
LVGDDLHEGRERLVGGYHCIELAARSHRQSGRKTYRRHQSARHHPGPPAEKPASGSSDTAQYAGRSWAASSS